MATGRAGAAAVVQSLNALTLATRDMAGSCRFYSKLGLHLSFGGPAEPFSTFSADTAPASLLANARTPLPYPGTLQIGCWVLTVIHKHPLMSGSFSLLP